MTPDRWHIVFWEGEDIERGFRTTSKILAELYAFAIGFIRPFKPSRVCVATFTRSLKSKD